MVGEGGNGVRRELGGYRKVGRNITNAVICSCLFPPQKWRGVRPVPQPVSAGDAMPPAPGELIHLFSQFSGFQNAGLALSPEKALFGCVGARGDG